MTKLVFLVEEPSMADLLDGLLPRLFPALRFQCVPHDGKQDLEKSIPRKLRAWREPGVRFVVARDQDSADCRQVKARLADLCRNAGRADVLVRVVCRELEAWYIGDPEALVRAFPEARRRRRMLRELSRARYRNPDTVGRPSDRLRDRSLNSRNAWGQGAWRTTCRERTVPAAFRSSWRESSACITRTPAAPDHECDARVVVQRGYLANKVPWLPLEPLVSPEPE